MHNRQYDGNVYNNYFGGSYENHLRAAIFQRKNNGGSTLNSPEKK
jgi:hypothetical protein